MTNYRTHSLTTGVGGALGATGDGAPPDRSSYRTHPSSGGGGDGAPRLPERARDADPGARPESRCHGGGAEAEGDSGLVAPRRRPLELATRPPAVKVDVVGVFSELSLSTLGSAAFDSCFEGIRNGI